MNFSCYEVVHKPFLLLREHIWPWVHFQALFPWKPAVAGASGVLPGNSPRLVRLPPTAETTLEWEDSK